MTSPRPRSTTPTQHPGAVKSDPRCQGARHGNASAYTKFGCRCPEARRDKKRQDYLRATGRPLTVPSIGTRRRIQALIAIGWSGRTIMAEMGWRGASLGAQFYQQDRVYAETARRAKEVYDRLSNTPGPSNKSRGRAKKSGFEPPLAWDDATIDDPNVKPWCYATGVSGTPSSVIDEVAVQRAVHGDRIDLCKAERREAVLRLWKRGDSYSEIAERLHTHSRMVHRDLQALGVIANHGQTVGTCEDARSMNESRAC